MAQTLVNLMVHVVFSTKNRQPMITQEDEEFMLLLKKYHVPYDERYLWS